MILIAFLVEIARGNDGAPYNWLGAITAIAYLAAIAVLRARGKAPTRQRPRRVTR